MKIANVELQKVGKKRENKGEIATPSNEQSSIEYPRIQSWNTGMDVPKGLKVGDKAVMIAEVKLKRYSVTDHKDGTPNSVDFEFEVLQAGFRDTKKKAADMSESELNESIEEEREKE